MRVRETDESHNEYRDLSANLPSRSPRSKKNKKEIMDLWIEDENNENDVISTTIVINQLHKNLNRLK